MTTEQKNEMEKAGTRGGGNGWTYIPDADIYESDKEYLVALTMPGVSEKSVDVAVENNVLTVRGTLETGTPEGYRVVRVEHGAGRYERAFTLSDDLDGAAIKAKMKNGILGLSIPKKEKAVPKKIAITVE